MDLKVGQVVWGRRNKNDIYWPGKIVIISNTGSDMWSFQTSNNYFVQFFVTNQSFWIRDIYPYRQHKDSMANYSFINYSLDSTLKQDFINAVYQADYACNYEINRNNNSNTLTSITTFNNYQSLSSQIQPYKIENNTNNDILLTSADTFSNGNDNSNLPYQQTFQSNSNSTSQSIGQSSSNSNETLSNYDNINWYSKQGLLVESITPPLPNDTHNQLVDSLYLPADFQKTNSIINLITTKFYSNLSFVSYLYNSLSKNDFQCSIIFLEDLNIYHHPNSLYIIHLFFIDNFEAKIEQILNTTILTNFNIHTNYLFLIINSPTYKFIEYFHSIITDKQTIVILNYQQTSDNDTILLCSCYRTTFELIENKFLKYLCSKIKYIQADDNDNNQILYSSYFISSIIQSANALNYFLNEQIHRTLNEKFDFEFLQNNENIIQELFPQLVISNATNFNNQNQFSHNIGHTSLNTNIPQNKIVHDLFENGAIKTNVPPPISEYYAQNILFGN